MQVVNRELEARERTMVLRGEISRAGEGSRGIQMTHTTKKIEKGSATTLKTGQGVKEGHVPACCYCSGNHAPEECTVVPEVADRRSSGRCFVCSRKGHMGRDCRSRLKCCLCKG